MIQLRIRRVGNSLGVTLPSGAVQALRVREGDTVYLTESPGGYRLTPYDPQFAGAMKVAEDLLGRYRNALRDLAK